MWDWCSLNSRKTILWGNFWISRLTLHLWGKGHFEIGTYCGQMIQPIINFTSSSAFSPHVCRSWTLMRMSKCVKQDVESLKSSGTDGKNRRVDWKRVECVECWNMYGIPERINILVEQKLEHNLAYRQHICRKTPMKLSNSTFNLSPAIFRLSSLDFFSSFFHKKNSNLFLFVVRVSKRVKWVLSVASHNHYLTESVLRV